MSFLDIAQLIQALLAFGLLIFVHELGHFIAALYCGITVEKFSIGFGPRLIGFTKNDIEYCISIIPFGGYVKMAGEDPTERDEEEEQIISTEGNPTGEFHTAPVRHRILVAIAGPLVNLVFGLILYSFMFMVWGEETVGSMKSTRIGHIQVNSAAEAADLKVGDQIVSVDGKKVRNWSELTETIMLTPPRNKVKLNLIREGRTVIASATTKSRKVGSRTVSQLGILPYQTLFVSGPPKIEGLQDQDQIIAIDGQEIHSQVDFNTKSQKGPVDLTIGRNGKLFTIKNVLVNWHFQISSIPKGNISDKFESGDKVLRINGKPISAANLNELFQELDNFARNNNSSPVSFQLEKSDQLTTTAEIKPTVRDKRPKGNSEIDWHGLGIRHTYTNLVCRENVETISYNFFTGWKRGAEESLEAIYRTFNVVQKLFTQSNTIGLVSGPVGILRIITKQSGPSLVFLIAFISINLAIVNLLPLAITDGGQILLFLIEAIRGKPIKLKYQVGIQTVAVVLLILLAVYITINDVRDLFSG